MRFGLIFLLFVTVSLAQSGVVTSGGDIENISYTIGNNLVELQIPVTEEIALGVPKYEIEQPKKPASKKKTFLEKIIAFIKRLNLF